MSDVSLVIVSKDRPDALRQTLRGLDGWFPESGEILLYDDSASPGGVADLARLHSRARVFSGPSPVGPCRARNVLLRHARGRFAICLDDDAEILTADACRIVERYFDAHPRCGIVTFRVWWSLESPGQAVMNPVADEPYACNDFLAGAHAIRTDWARTGPYAEWMNIYGEESYVALGTARDGREVHYLPSVLVHHRARPVEERGDPEYVRWWLRQQLFNQLGIVAARLPARAIPLRTMQLLSHYVWRYGIRQGLLSECGSAVASFVARLPEILTGSGRLTPADYRQWRALPPPVYYWSPDGD